RALRAQRVHAGRDLADRLVRPVGRRAREAARAAHHPRARECDGAAAAPRQLDERADPPPSRAAHGGIMTDLGFDQPLYILPSAHRGSFKRALLGGRGALPKARADGVPPSRAILSEASPAAVGGGFPKDRAGLPVDEHFGAAFLRAAGPRVFLTAAPAE